jgi:hypothetical protein
MEIEGGGAAPAAARGGAGPYGSVAELTAAPETEHAPWIRPLSCYERRETTIVEGTRYG